MSWARTRERGLGCQGIAEPTLLEGVGNACGWCVAACEEQALTMVDDLPVRDVSKCNYCGDCIKICPIDAMLTGRKGWLVRTGGKHGKHPIYAYEIAQFASDDDCLSLIEKTMLWYKENADGRERIGATIARLGLDKYLDEVVKPAGLEVISTPEERRKFRASGTFYS